MQPSDVHAWTRRMSAPASASAMAICAPIPLVTPVHKAVLLSREKSSVCEGDGVQRLNTGTQEQYETIPWKMTPYRNDVGTRCPYYVSQTLFFPNEAVEPLPVAIKALPRMPR